MVQKLRIALIKMLMSSKLSSDVCQEESSEWRAQENARQFLGKSRAVIGWKKTNKRASLVHNL